MQIITRFNFNVFRIHGRAYILQEGFEKAYDGKVKNAVAHLQETLDGKKLKRAQEQGFSFAHAIMRGTRIGEKRMDFVGYHFYTMLDWPGEVESSFFTTENGILVRTKDITTNTLGIGVTILGAEEKYRQTTKNCEQYMTNPPQIDGLEYVLGDNCVPKED